MAQDTTRVRPMAVPQVVPVGFSERNSRDERGRGTGGGLSSPSGSARWDSLQAAQERVHERMDGVAEASDAGAEELLEEMEALAASPVQINRASVEELMAVPGLSGTLAQAVVAYRESEHPFRSVEELEEVRGIGPATMEAVRPFVTIGPPEEQREDVWLDPSLWVRGGRLEVVSRVKRPLELAQGYRDGSFVGGPEATYQRVVWRSDHLSAGTIHNKRSGESAAGWRAPGAMPFYLALEDLGRLRSLVVGDYRAGFGQGLVLGSGGMFGKGANAVGSVNRGGSGVRGHTSSSSSHSFRGVAVELGSVEGDAGWSGGPAWLSDASVMVFGSRRPRTASVVGDSIRMPVASPSYRTELEAGRRNNVMQTTGGVRVGVEVVPGASSGGVSGVEKSQGVDGSAGPSSSVEESQTSSKPAGWRTVESLQLGLGWIGNHWDRPVVETPDPWMAHRSGGRGFQAISADVRMALPGAQLFGELARSGNGAWALLTGVELAPGERTRWVLSWRDYAPNFQSVFGSAFGEQSGAPRNERGLYAGVDHRFGPRIRLQGYLDLFTFPGPRWLTRQASHGHDGLGRLEFEPVDGQEWQLQARQKVRGEEFVAEDRWGEPIRLLAPERRWSARIQVSQELEHGMRVRARIEQVVSAPAGGSARGPCTDPELAEEAREQGIWCDWGSGETRSAGGSAGGENSTDPVAGGTGSARKGVSRGWGGWVDFRVPLGQALRLDMRVTTFRTDDFDSRLYSVEGDLLYSFASRMLYGRGERIYLMASWSPLPAVQIQGKIATTVLREEREASDPRMQIDGRRRSDVGVQVRLRL